MRFFIVCPANIATGGTELLHQFSQSLSNNNLENYMLYFKTKETEPPTQESFFKYNVKYVSEFVDAEDSVLVLPEVCIHHISVCSKGVVMIWWLSVDGYFTAYKRLIQTETIDVFELAKRSNVVHFVQSAYAADFVEKQIGIPKIYLLKDYINEDIVEVARQYRDKLPRENICLYNPRKGYQNLRPLIAASQADVRWVALQGLTPTEMAQIMCVAKVYIDFGHHPGMDRIPREAAYCGCCVITNTQGSAGYEEDVPIPQQYKIKDMSNVDGVLDIIYELMDNYQIHQEEYKEYVERIDGEREEFERDTLEAVTLIKDVLKEKGQSAVTIEVDKYHDLYQSIEDALEAIKKIAKGAEQSYNQGDVTQSNRNLLNVDYTMRLVRETVWAIIHDMNR